MFELKISDTPDFQQRINTLRCVIESVADLVDDAEIKVSETGLQIQVMDTMHIAFADIHLAADAFDEFRADRSILLGVKFKELLKVLRNVKPGECTGLSISCEDDARKLTVKVDAADYTLRFTLCLFRFDIESYELPVMEYDVQMAMAITDFMRIPKAVGAFSENLIIHARPSEVHFIARGSVTDSDMTLTSGGAVQIDVKKEMQKELAMRYVNAILKGAQICDGVRLCMGEDKPVLFEFTMQSGHLKYIVAPKTDN